MCCGLETFRGSCDVIPNSSGRSDIKGNHQDKSPSANIAEFETILDVVEKEKVNLIVMAKRRKLKGVKKLLSLGSVSRKIVENISCPVLLIDVEK